MAGGEQDGGGMKMLHCLISPVGSATSASIVDRASLSDEQAGRVQCVWVVGHTTGVDGDLGRTS